MGYDSPDPYHQPEDFDLEQVAVIDFSDGNYQFDYRVIWRHLETGVLYTAADSGCSCPSPFEDYTLLADLDIANIPELIEEARDKDRDSYYAGDFIIDYIDQLKSLKQV